MMLYNHFPNDANTESWIPVLAVWTPTKTDSKVDLSIHWSHRSHRPKSVFQIVMIPVPPN